MRTRVKMVLKYEGAHVSNGCHRTQTEPVRDKTNNLGFDKVRHKPDCTVTEDGQRLEILDLESRGIILSVRRKQRR